MRAIRAPEKNHARFGDSQSKGCLPEGFCTVRFPLVFHNGTSSNHRAGPILRWDQLQSEAIWFTALPDAALYTTTFSRDFQAMKGRLSCLWLAGTNIRESLRVDNNTWRQSIKCKKQTNNTFNLKTTGDRDLQLFLAAQRKNTSWEVLLCNANALHCAFLLTLGWANLPEARSILWPS